MRLAPLAAAVNEPVVGRTAPRGQDREPSKPPATRPTVGRSVAVCPPRDCHRSCRLKVPAAGRTARRTRPGWNRRSHLRRGPDRRPGACSLPGPHHLIDPVGLNPGSVGVGLPAGSSRGHSHDARCGPPGRTGRTRRRADAVRGRLEASRRCGCQDQMASPRCSTRPRRLLQNRQGWDPSLPSTHDRRSGARHRDRPRSSDIGTSTGVPAASSGAKAARNSAPVHRCQDRRPAELCRSAGAGVGTGWSSPDCRQPPAGFVRCTLAVAKS